MQGSFFGEPQHSGQGAAFREAGDVKVLVVTVVNAFGAIVDRQGAMLRCGHAAAGDCGLIADRLSAHLAALTPPKTANAEVDLPSGLTANTTISVVVTNQTLPFWALQRLAVQVHNSMARAIQPFGTEFDGDTLFAVSTAEVKNRAVSAADLGALASEAAWDAVLASAPVLPVSAPAPSVTLSAAQLDACRGRYEFAPGAVAEVRQTGGGLEIIVPNRESRSLPADRWIPLRPVGPDDFELAPPGADRLRFDRDAHGHIVGLTVAPGPWPLRARRLQPASRHAG